MMRNSLSIFAGLVALLASIVALASSASAAVTDCPAGRTALAQAHAALAAADSNQGRSLEQEAVKQFELCVQALPPGVSLPYVTDRANVAIGR
jgi:hypothetical protein